MRRSSRSKWVSGIGAVVLIGGLVLANSGSGVTPAAAAPAPPNPFTVIIDKLNQILAKLSTSSEGNHTLRWDTNNPSATRFTTAFTGAVLDNNTGLVWEQAPDATTRVWGDGTDASATRYCVNKAVGGTRGWRLPSVAELSSLIDPSLPAPFVPASVFTGVELDHYWSASTDAGNPAKAWDNSFLVAAGLATDGKASIGFRAWCVRGPMQESVY